MGNIVLFESKDKCCGCGACMNICPKSAITMQEDEYGFIYPVIDEELCIECGACKRACAYQNTEVTNVPIASYAAVNKNVEQKKKSASGGLFAGIATQFLEKGGVAFGASLEKNGDDFTIHHIKIDRVSDLPKLQGSKYVQSSTEYSYKEVRQCLKEGKQVLYCGTPCQIAGLYGFLGRDDENLLTIDLICHGVPNARFFNDFLKNEAKKLKCDHLEYYVFRDKLKGWGMNGRLDYAMPDGIVKSKYTPARLASYNTLFLDSLTYRENCYSCKYACEKRPADITIGDYWGIEKEHPELLGEKVYDEKLGISCLIVNTEKGKKYADEFENLRLDISDFAKVANRNGQLQSPSHRPEKREKILNLYKEQGYAEVDKLFKEKYKKQILMHRIFNAMPRKLRNRLKGIMKK